MHWSWSMLSWIVGLSASTVVVTGTYIVVLGAALWVLVGIVREHRRNQ